MSAPPVDFARNPAAPDAAQALLAASSPEPGETAWALLDRALVDARPQARWVRALGWPVANALETSPLAAYGEHAPLWMQLPTDPEAAAQGLHRLLELNRTAPALSVVCTRSDAGALQQLGAYLGCALIDGDLTVHCRFADTRVLPHLLDGLTESQRCRVAATVRRWAWPDHHGQVRSRELPPCSATPGAADEAGFLRIDAHHFSTMLAASEPDTMLSLLVEHMPELVPAGGRGHFRDRLAHLLSRADARKLGTPTDRLQFTVLGLSIGDSFDDHPLLQACWDVVARGAGTLVEDMQRWSDSLWTQLERQAAARPATPRS